MDDVASLKERIRELEQELQAKEAELARIRLRLSATNSRLEQVIEKVAGEIGFASRIQKLLSPVEIPNIPGFDFSTKFVPSMKSGGDYFDIFEHQDRLRFGIVLAASSGYAMSALFLSVLLKLSTRMQARQGLTPDGMISAVVKEARGDLKDDSRASLFYGIVDRRSYELNYCLIGNVAGFVQAAGQDALIRLEPGGPPLSREFNTEPPMKTQALNPRDRVILVTEGLLQASNAKGQKWGEAGLIDALRSAPRQGVHELRNEILFRCESFSGKSEPDRDQTVLVLEVKDKVIKLAKD